MKTETYARKSFEVEAVQVTAENMEEVAQWCDGRVQTQAGTDTKPETRYVKVQVRHSLNERQTKAYIDDWVLLAGTGFKVYPKKAFESSFDKVETNVNPNQYEIQFHSPELGMANVHNQIHTSGITGK